MQAGVVGLLKGSQVARFALPAPQVSAAAPSVPAQTPSSVGSSSAPTQHAHPITPQPPPAGPATVSQPPPAKPPTDPTSTPLAQHAAASSGSSPASLPFTSSQQQDPPIDKNASTASALTDAASTRGQATASTSGEAPPQVKDPALSEQAPLETQPTGSQGAAHSVKADSVVPDSSVVEPQPQMSPPLTAAGDEATAEADSAAASSVVLGGSGETAITPQQSQSQRLVTQTEGESGPAETVASDAAGAPAEPQHEAAGAEPGNASRPSSPERDPAQNAQAAEQPPTESSESETRSASRQQQAQFDQEAHADVCEGSHAGTDAAELSTSTDTHARVGSSLVPETNAEDKQELASTSGTATGAAGSSKQTQEDHTSLHEPSADGSPAAQSASRLASDDQAGPDESQQEAGQGAQQQVQQVTKQAADELLQSSAGPTDHDAVGPGTERRTPAVRPPVVAHEDSMNNRGMLQAPVTVEESPSGAATKQTQGQVAAPEGPLAYLATADESPASRRAAAAPVTGGVGSLKPPASPWGEEKHGTTPAVPGTRVSTVSSGAPSEATRSHAASSSASARDANKHLNESQNKETEARVLSPKGSLKSRQTVEMKRQQTSFNPLG